MSNDAPGAILDGIPVADPGIAGSGHGPAQELVVVQRVRQQAAGNVLVVQLPQREPEAEGLVLGDDRVGGVDHGQRRAAKVPLDVEFSHLSLFHNHRLWINIA
jgi:hypothetical protein